jgi:hypothetical protein
MCRDWAGTRVQWGQPVGKHDAIAQKLGSMAADTFAMEAVVELTAAMADTHELDIRLEAAIAKLWNTERAWTLANDALQIRGGRGYETHDSLEARGETPYPIERMVRDLRINMIFEGSSEIMRLFIAREAVDDHLEVAGDLVNPRAPTGKRVAAAARAGLHYLWWFPTRFLGWGLWPRYAEFGPLARHLRFVDRNARRLSRSIFYAMMRFGPGLEKRQAVLGRIVDAGAELFVMTSACVRAEKLRRARPDDASPVTLADLFCRQSRRRVRASFAGLFANDDAATYRVARQVLDGRFAWLEEGVIGMKETYGAADRGLHASPARDEPTPREPEPAGAD